MIFCCIDKNKIKVQNSSNVEKLLRAQISITGAFFFKNSLIQVVI
ncbi:hypothetical protein HMPREF3208_00407 [Gardnerella vaginalis]|uniref:Uncharacterized protein n=1 Tax=Gardnerella vaginalis TaxID=2702 RepID=A0A133P0S9_GARVA|nr:hypothetical protein HMPREF3208_00407 [Gardnerella vaginalis]